MSAKDKQVILAETAVENFNFKPLSHLSKWLKLKLYKSVTREQIIEFMVDLAAGKVMDHRVTSLGGVVQVPASVRDRMDAATYLIDRLAGKASQSVEVKDESGGKVQFAIINFNDSETEKKVKVEVNQYAQDNPVPIRTEILSETTTDSH